MSTRRSPWLRLVTVLVYAFLYAPIVVLILFSFNASRANVTFPRSRRMNASRVSMRPMRWGLSPTFSIVTSLSGTIAAATAANAAEEGSPGTTICWARSSG